MSILSEYLEYNFFQFYVDNEPLKSMFGDEITKLKRKVSQLEKNLVEKDDIISDKKNIISFLEEKISKLEQPKQAAPNKGNNLGRK